MRHRLGDLDVPSVLGVSNGEHDINLLERSSSGLGVEDVNEGNETDVEDTEDEESVGVDGGEHRGSQLDDSEVPCPVGHRGDSVGVGSSSERVDLSGVQPRKLEPSRSEGEEVEEDTEDSSVGGGGGTRKKRSEDDQHRNSLENGSDQEHDSSTDSLDSVEGEDRSEGVAGNSRSTENERKLSRQTEILFENDRSEVDNSVGSRDLLHELRRSSETDSSKMLSGSTSEHISLPGDTELGGSSNGGGDDVDLEERLLRVEGRSVESGGDLLSFSGSSDREQPSRGFGKEVDSNKKSNTEDDLESNRESPVDGRRDERETEVDPVRQHSSGSNHTSFNRDVQSTVVRL